MQRYLYLVALFKTHRDIQSRHCPIESQIDKDIASPIRPNQYFSKKNIANASELDRRPSLLPQTIKN